VLVIPSLDLTAGRSRVVFWPGAAAGVGTPTDRPEAIAARFVDQGARTAGVVLGEALLTGRIEYLAAMEAAA
jgi:phosphoribosylformimino-5-aminoimidazole carboxamide ribonucleotide (ProFAR) isomerase